MCLVCNRSSIAMQDEVRRWFELNAVKAAASLGTGLSHFANMASQFELADHLGADTSVCIEEGKKALEVLDSTRALYAENVMIAREHALDPGVASKLERTKLSAREMGFTGTEEQWEELLALLKKDSVAGLFGKMHKQVKELQEDLGTMIKELEQGKMIGDRFGPYIAKWHDLLRTGHYGGRVYASLGGAKK